jgi:EAL domain-containing protein (putative c-di-GMP-specific phosphodiesterase class I)
MRDQAFARLELENDLRRALERDELELHYQPIVAVSGGGLLGFEALVRWRRSPGRLATPAEFIALAEETGLVVPLGAWVLRRACFQLREWRATIPGAESLAVSVNVAGSQLLRGELLGEIDAALGDSGLDPSGLKLEITESSVVDHLGPASAVLREIEQRGVGLWLDDFGTGYSSLSYLHRLPIQAMKIDRSFVAELGSGNGAGALIRTIVLLARHLGLRTIAEGVEAPEQSQRLRALGCEFVQGHLISYPLDAASAGQMIAAAAAPTTSES